MSASRVNPKKRKSGAAPVTLSEPLQQCLTILKSLQAKPEAAPFLEPVDWEHFGLNDYPEIIKNPMDLGTVQTRLEEGKYSTPQAFASDIRLIWKNAQTYNRPDSDIHVTAGNLSKMFEKKFAAIKTGTTKKGKTETSSTDREVTRADRIKFSQVVNQLSSDELGELIEKLQKECPEALNEEDDEEIEIEINHIDPKTLVALNDFATQCIANANSEKRKK